MSQYADMTESEILDVIGHTHERCEWCGTTSSFKDIQASSDEGECPSCGRQEDLTPILKPETETPKKVTRGDVTDDICEFYISGNVTGGDEPNTDYHACIWRDTETGEIMGHMSNGHFDNTERTRDIPQQSARKAYLWAWSQYYA